MRVFLRIVGLKAVLDLLANILVSQRKGEKFYDLLEATWNELAKGVEAVTQGVGKGKGEEEEEEKEKEKEK
jgi:hypothetical protein